MNKIEFFNKETGELVPYQCDYYVTADGSVFRDYNGAGVYLRPDIGYRTTEVQELQATIDRLMLEYCPEEMTQEQKDNWAKHQKRNGE